MDCPCTQYMSVCIKYIKGPTNAILMYGCNVIAQQSLTSFGNSCGHETDVSIFLICKWTGNPMVNVMPDPYTGT